MSVLVFQAEAVIVLVLGVQTPALLRISRRKPAKSAVLRAGPVIKDWCWDLMAVLSV
jgi:hypothetical protein